MIEHPSQIPAYYAKKEELEYDKVAYNLPCSLTPETNIIYEMATTQPEPYKWLDVFFPIDSMGYTSFELKGYANNGMIYCDRMYESFGYLEHIYLKIPYSDIKNWSYRQSKHVMKCINCGDKKC